MGDVWQTLEEEKLAFQAQVEQSKQDLLSQIEVRVTHELGKYFFVVTMTFLSHSHLSDACLLLS